MRGATASQSQPEETQAPTVMNPEMWVQLTVEQHQKTSWLLEAKEYQQQEPRLGLQLKEAVISQTLNNLEKCIYFDNDIMNDRSRFYPQRDH